jgi:hypothetical protein
MPIINSISTADNTTLTGYTNNNGFTNQLVYFIVQLVIQTEYASNGNKNLTQKQITELFNIGATMAQMYALTVKAGFADNATFLSSIPLAYAPTDANSKSIFDEIISLEIPNMLDYVSIIKYVNTPGLACWAFGSVAKINASLNEAFAIDSSLGTLSLQKLVYNDTNGSDGNSINALWTYFNTSNDFPTNFTNILSTSDTNPLTIANVQKSIPNWVALDKFLTGSTNAAGHSWSTSKTYTYLVVNAKIPFEVLLCSNPYLVSTNTFSFTKTDIKRLNKIWAFLTNGSIGSSSVPISFDQISNNNPIVSGLDFKSALAYLKVLGYEIQHVMNVDKSSIVQSSPTGVITNAVSEVVKQLAEKPSLIYDFIDIYDSFATYDTNNYYLFDLMKNYNTAVAKCASVGTVASSNPVTTLTIDTTLNRATPGNSATAITIYAPANLTFGKVFASTILPVTYEVNGNTYYYATYDDAVTANPDADASNSFKVNGQPVQSASGVASRLTSAVAVAATTAQINAFNNLQFTNTLLNTVLSNKNLAFRMSLNGFYSLSTLTLQQASSFLYEDDNKAPIFNLVQNTTNYTAATSNTSSYAKFISQADLYLFNKLVALGNSNIKYVAIDSLVTHSTDFVTLLNTDGYPKLILGNGLYLGNGTSQTWRYVIKSAIAKAYSYNTSNNLTFLVNGVGDYNDKGVIGNLTSDSKASDEIDIIVFTTQVGRISRAIGEVGPIKANDWQAIANLVGEIFTFGSLTDIDGTTTPLTVRTFYALAQNFNTGVNGNSSLNTVLGGDINAAIAAYILLYDCPLSKKLDDLDLLFNHVQINNDSIITGSNKNINIARRMVTISDKMNINLGAKLISIALSPGIANKILNITNLINFWFSENVTYQDNVPIVKPSYALTTVINSFFSLSGLQMSDIQNQIIIKKLMNVYNGVSNHVINVVYANNKPLGMWAKYVNLFYLCYTDDTKSVSNYDVDEILTVSQQISIYDFASGRSTGIVNIQLITAENLVEADVISIGQLPEYIAYTQTVSGSGSSIVTSQQVSLQLIVAIAKAMDTASATRSYTTRLFQRIMSFTATGTASGVKIAADSNALQRLFSIITGANPVYYDGIDANGTASNDGTDGISANNIVLTSPLTDSNAILAELNRTASVTLNLSTSDINAVLNWIFKGYNADGTPLPFVDTSSYYSYYNGEY